MNLSVFRTIRTHLLLIAFVSALPALAIIIYSGFHERSRAVETAKLDALHVVKIYSYDHERVVESTRQFLMTLSRVPDIRSLNPRSSNNLLSQLLKQNPLYSTLFVVTPDGYVNATGLPPLPPTPISVQQRRYFKEVTRTKLFSAGEYAICPAVKRPVLNFGYPILNDCEQIIGAVALSLDLAHYAKMFPMDKLPRGTTLTISDSKGTPLYHFPVKEDNAYWDILHLC